MLLLPLLALLPWAQEAPASLAYPSLRPERLAVDMQFLASDELGGRATGSFGAQVAAEFIASRFRAFGLQGGNRGQFFQSFPASIRRLDQERCGLKLFDAGGELLQSWQAGESFLPHPGAPLGRVRAPVAFAGYALTSPEMEYDDFGLLDLEGKVALILRWEPQANQRNSRFHGRRFLPQSQLAKKIRACRERGAVAVLVADAPGLLERFHSPGAPYWPAFSRMFNQLIPLVQAQLDPKELADTNFTAAQVADQLYIQLQVSGPLGTDLPVFFISRPVLERLFRTAERSPSEWVADVDLAEAGRSFELPASVELQAALQTPGKWGRNVVAVLPGSVKPDEFIVIGAHFDHVGHNEAGTIWNGADDNASGVVGLLALAEAFAGRDQAPERSLMFVAFSGEEYGLLGSAWFLQDPPVPWTSIAAMVNLDMIGRSRNRRLHVVGTRSSPMLRSLVERHAEDLALDLDFESEEFFDRSDQAPFYYAGIPVVFFNTDEHPDYHRPTDTWLKIDYQSQSRILILAHRLIRSLADLKQAPPFEDGYNRLRPVFQREARLRVQWPISFEQRLDF
ncbi:MAG: hypothetical protein DWQ01_11590 [Planctomycetota bacterium]|nr:MAG: hypothetical protein DWQ01_11590 [Planctomycetota bacterium]